MTVKKEVLMPLSVVALYLVSYKNCVASDEYSETIWFNHRDNKFYIKMPKELELNPLARFVESVKDLYSFKFHKQAIEKYKNWDGKYKVEEIPFNVIIEDKCNRKLTLTYEVEDE